ncbi:MAG: C4-dicarboxylate TRAP transporter substrate-binding protein [Alphaproteobacteria bacterium]|nr:C4-dicarboxylate TRAP transporter substrate-binding protein [Alphaproteobacteria bacterium]
MTRKCLSAAVVAVTFAWAAQPAGAAEYIANNFLDANHPFSAVNYTEWAGNVKKATKGEITFKVFLGGSLVPARSTLPGVKDGLAHVAYHAGTYTPSELPLTNVLADLSLLTSDIYVSMAATTEMGFFNPKLQAEWNKVGVVYGGGYSTAPYLLLCNKKISSLTEIKSKRLRMPGGLWDRWAVHVGAIAVNVPSSEIFTGLERGTLDCGANPLESLESRSYWDVAKYVIELPIGVYYAGPMWAYNIPFWKSLKPEQRATLLDVTARSMVRSSIAYLDNTARAEKAMGAKGVQWVKPAADLLAANKDFVAKDAQALGKMAQEKLKVNPADSEAIIAEYKNLVTKWEKAFAGVNPRDEERLYSVLKTGIFAKIDPKTYGTR